MGDDTQARFDELMERLDELEAENSALREKVPAESASEVTPADGSSRPLSRRAVLAGGAVAVGAAAAAASHSRADAAGTNPVELDVSNTGKHPTRIVGTIDETGIPTGMFTSAFVANNENPTAGSGIYSVARTYGVAGLASGPGGAGVFARSEAGGQGLHGWVYGNPSTPASEWTAGVVGQCSYVESPAFLADAGITLRTLANEGGIPVSDDAEPGDLSIRTDPAGTSTWWVCVQGAGVDPAEFVRVAAPGAAGAFEALASPIRVYDSRAGATPATGPKSPLVGPAERAVSCEENTGGAVPADARAVVVNLTVTNTSAAGYAAIFPGGAAWGGTSNVNFDAGQTIANAATVGCGADATITVRVGEAGVSTDFIVDVMGFYR